MLATPLQFMRSQFSHLELEEEQWRSVIGRSGITGYAQTTQIGKLSDGQKSRIVFCCITLNSPHILMLDEPTNHLGTPPPLPPLGQFEFGEIPIYCLNIVTNWNLRYGVYRCSRRWY